MDIESERNSGKCLSLGDSKDLRRPLSVITKPSTRILYDQWSRHVCSDIYDGLQSLRRFGGICCIQLSDYLPIPSLILSKILYAQVLCHEACQYETQSPG